MSGIEVRVEALEMVYEIDGEQVHALRGVDLDFAPGESIALLGPSGSGKSSLLTLLAGLQKPTAGRALLDGHDVTAMSERELLTLRARDVGVVVQGPARNLLPYANAEENVRFAQRAVPRDRRDRLPAPAELLEGLGLGHVRRSRLGALSGGEQQRLSLAVGLAGAPGLLLADEPTSQLDATNRAHVVDMLTAAAANGTTIVVVTHDEHMAQQVDRSVHLRDGLVVP
ncbi:MAG: transporter ATP-binding protein [Frankiales bacterium]|nr:transporter ATP-binding protein [Frankiales bacterium]